MATYVFTSSLYVGLEHHPQIDADGYADAILAFLHAREVPDAVIANRRVYDQPDDRLPRDCTLVWVLDEIDDEPVRTFQCGFTIPLGTQSAA